MDGRPTLLTCRGTIGLLELRIASSVEGPTEPVPELYRLRRFVFQ